MKARTTAYSGLRRREDLMANISPLFLSPFFYASLYLPAFMMYSLFVLGFSTFMIYRVVPKWGNKSPIVNISICSFVGSITVMASKGFGIALKLTFAGSNQLTHPSTYVFALLVGICIVVQMNYFNKALDMFSTNV